MQAHREREHTEARFLSDQLLEEGRWHHVMVVLNKALIRNSTCALFVDGKHVNTSRVREFYLLVNHMQSTSRRELCYVVMLAPVVDSRVFDLFISEDTFLWILAQQPLIN